MGVKPSGLVAGRSARSTSAVIATSAVTAGLAALSLWPFWVTDPVTGVINLLVAVSFVATATVLGEMREYRTTGIALAAAALFWLMSWWWRWPVEWQVGPLALLSNVFGYWWFVCGGVALLRYPHTRLTRWERAYFVSMAAWIVLGKVAIALVSEPEWNNNYNPASWWPTVAPDRNLYRVLDSIFYVGIVSLAVLMLLLLLLKLRRARGMERLDSVPVVVAACAVTVSGAVYLGARVIALPEDMVANLRTFMGVAALVTPLAFLMTVLRRRLARLGIADFIEKTNGVSTVVHIQNELRSALYDDSLKLWLWLADEGQFVAVDGEQNARPQDTANATVEIMSSVGDLLGVLEFDDALRRYPGLMDSAVVAAGRVLELESAINQLSASRKRIAAAADEERRRIERDLHDGVQSSLLGATATLAAARIKAEDYPDVVAAIDQAHTGIRTALGELRALARGGVHPDRLGTDGLLPTIRSVAGNFRPLRIELQICDRRWRDEVEKAIYYLVCEALSNIVKHAAASRATVTISTDETTIDVVISDDGCGGAVVSPGSGLAGLKDRVLVLGGTLTVDSAAGRGTSVRAAVPCE